MGLKGGASKNLVITTLDCKITFFLNIKMHLILDRMSYLLYDIIHQHVSGSGVPG